MAGQQSSIYMQNQFHGQVVISLPSTAISRASSMDSLKPPAHASESSTSRTPILNIRLVKKLPSGAVGTAARRGRARRKSGESNSGTGIQQESVPADNGLPQRHGS